MAERDKETAEILALQRECRERAQQQYERIRRPLEELGKELRAIHNQEQIDRMWAELSAANEAHCVTREPARPRWLPSWLHRLLTRLAGSLVTPHVREAELNQTRFNMHAVRALNEIVAKILDNEQVLLEHHARQTVLLTNLHTSALWKENQLTGIEREEAAPPEAKAPSAAAPDGRDETK